MFEFKKGTIEDIDIMINMTKEFYGDIEISNRDFIKWQYFNNPNGQAFIRIAYSKDEPAGQYIIIPMKTKVNDEIVDCTLSLNTLTREKFRGKNVFTLLANQVYDDCKKIGVEFTYGFPNQNSYNGFIKNLNFVDIGSVPLLIKPLDFKIILQKKMKNKFFSYCGSILNIFTKVNSSENRKVIEINNLNYMLFDEFWVDIQSEYKILGVRDSSYMKWRYLDIPLRRYKIIGIKKDERLVSYMVLRNTNIEDFNCGMIVDFLFISGFEQEAEILLKHAITLFKRDNMDMVGCLIKFNSKEYRVLRNSKFYKVPKMLEPQPFPVIIKNHIDCKKNNISIEDWFLTMGDYDVI